MNVVNIKDDTIVVNDINIEQHKSNNSHPHHLITNVLKNQYLLQYILKFTRNGQYRYYLGAYVPISHERLDEDAAGPKSKKKSKRTKMVVSKNYHQSLMDLVWVVKNKHYGLLKDILKSPDRRGSVNSFPMNYLISAVAKVDDMETVQLILSTYQVNFKEYFTYKSEHNNTNNIHKPLSVITDYFLLLIMNHGKIDIWNLFVNFINDNNCNPSNNNNINNNKGIKSIFNKLFKKDNSPKDDIKKTKKILSLMEYYGQEHLRVNNHCFIQKLLQYCILFGRRDIMISIINDIGFDRLDQYMDHNGKQEPYYSLPGNSPTPIFIPPLETRKVIREMVEDLSVKLSPLTFIQLFYKTSSVELIISHHYDLISSFLNNNYMNINRIIFSIFNNNLLLNNDQVEIKLQYDSLILLVNNFFNNNKNNNNYSINSSNSTLEIDINTINNMVQSLQLSSPTEKEYQYLWIMEFYIQFSNRIKSLSIEKPTSTPFDNVLFYEKSIKFINQYIYNNNNNNNNNSKIINYLIDRLGFLNICKYGSLDMVKEAYQILQPTSDFSRELIQLCYVLDVLPHENAKYILEQKHVTSLAGHCALLVETFVKRKQWDVVVYLVEQTNQIYQVTYKALKALLDHGYFEVVDTLLLKHQHSVDFQSIIWEKVNSVRLCKYYNIESSITPVFEPCDNDYGDKNESMDLVKYLLSINDSKVISVGAFGEPHNPLFKRMVEAAVKARRASIIQYLYHYFKKHCEMDAKFQQQKVETYFKINIDKAVQEFDVPFLDTLMKLDLPLTIEEFESWKAVGMYGSVEWIEKVLIKYTADDDLTQYFSSMRENVLKNKSMENRTAMLQYIDQSLIKDTTI